MGQLPSIGSGIRIEHGRYRALHHPPLMDALEKGTVPVHAITPARRKVLERSKTVGDRAKKLFTQHAGGDRMKAFEAAKAVLKMKSNTANGAKIFTRACATCHPRRPRPRRRPDLTGLRNQPAEALLLHIIVPNKEVYGQYAMYEVDTQDDETFAGLLAADTPKQLTLKLPLGLTKTIPARRSNPSAPPPTPHARSARENDDPAGAGRSAGVSEKVTPTEHATPASLAFSLFFEARLHHTHFHFTENCLLMLLGKRLGLVATALWALVGWAAEKNIVVVIADDLSPTMGCYEDMTAVTPNIQLATTHALPLRLCNHSQLQRQPQRGAFRPAQSSQRPLRASAATTSSVVFRG